MKLPEGGWRAQADLNALLAALDAESGAARFVGGAVRDTLLDLAVSDLDIATRLLPDDVMTRLKARDIRVIPTGIDHGTVTAVLPHGPIEITTLRRDVSTDGRRATIAFSDDWREDAARRDFTINALSADPSSGEIFDYFGGLDDLRNGRVRFIGDPLQRIAEDHLRILRFFRFHARFGRGAPDGPAMDACTARANDLMALSRERIADELLKLLALPHPAPTVKLMAEAGIFRPVLPEIEEGGVERLFRLTARETALGLPPEKLRRLAALLPPDPAAAAAVAARLRLSNKALKRLVSAASWPQPAGDPRLLAYAIGRDEALDRLLLRDTDEGLADAIAALGDWERPRLALSGGDLIAMGLEPGPAVARILQAVEREWSEGGFSDDGEAVRALARRHVDEALRDKA
ncbi:CCA tRNA nucleotidyltransferase [Allosphingosinicella flava]|uniref:CCA tRNA nucleotidyltransferase n=1 Tax=Allosphingosinicella flava TaxID=2771430 RepID=A0A7T2LL60_9SPHN|nr:CCA tRNA nucleotidyltransferase [Sphingosinicella flava]QPQ54023.1 CCA tRNA nucleotidyltransferase [Sphingosinicella flava]